VDSELRRLIAPYVRRPEPAASAFVIALLGTAVVTFSQPAKRFRYDALAYWKLADTFTKDGHFSMLNFDSPLRGYAFPFINHLLQSLGWSDSSTSKAFNIVVVAPKALDKVGSPVRTTGRALAFEGTVDVQVREDGMLAGQALGRGFVTGGGDVLRPYSGDVTFRAAGKPAGAMVFTEVSAADGTILRAAVVRVRF